MSFSAANFIFLILIASIIRIVFQKVCLAQLHFPIYSDFFPVIYCFYIIIIAEICNDIKVGRFIFKLLQEIYIDLR